MDFFPWCERDIGEKKRTKKIAVIIYDFDKVYVYLTFWPKDFHVSVDLRF